MRKKERRERGREREREIRGRERLEREREGRERERGGGGGRGGRALQPLFLRYTALTSLETATSLLPTPPPLPPHAPAREERTGCRWPCRPASPSLLFSRREGQTGDADEKDLGAGARGNGLRGGQKGRRRLESDRRARRQRLERLHLSRDCGNPRRPADRRNMRSRTGAAHGERRLRTWWYSLTSGISRGSAPRPSGANEERAVTAI